LFPLLTINDLRIDFITEAGAHTALNGISFQVNRGEIVGIAGESGSGKSVSSLAILQLLASPPARYVSGEILFSPDGLKQFNMVGLDRPTLQSLRGSRIAMIFQEPMTSLNPVFTCGDQVMEAIRLHEKISGEQARRKTIELFEKVRLPNPALIFRRYPHQLSGGQKQRVMIAMAICGNPSLLICDEPTTALDVTVQKSVLELLAELQSQTGMGVIFITHDLGVIAEIAHKTIILYKGNIVEEGPTADVLIRPVHPYTRGLLACRPVLYTKGERLPTADDFMEKAEQYSGGENYSYTLTLNNKLNKENSEREAAGTDETARTSAPESYPGSLPVETNDIKESAPEAKEYPDVVLGETAGAKEDISLPTEHPAALQAKDETKEHPYIAQDNPNPVLLKVENLELWFPSKKSFTGKPIDFIKAIDNINFEIYGGETLGLVGESGCGKTTLGRALLRLIDPTGGRVLYRDKDLAGYSGAQLKAFRKNTQIIFQDPYSSLNPAIPVGKAIEEPMKIHRLYPTAKERRERTIVLLEKVNLQADHYNRYPHEFSGGQRQRIVIARALASQPDFIVCDESVSALDVSIQAQVLNLLNDLKKELGFTSIFISHDLSVVRYVSDRIMVMNKGKIEEIGEAEQVYRHPQKTYTRQLLEAIPGARLDPALERQ